MPLAGQTAGYIYKYLYNNPNSKAPIALPQWDLVGHVW